MAKDNVKSARRPSRIDGRSELDSRGVAQLIAIGRLLEEITFPRNEYGLPILNAPERDAELRKRLQEAEEAFDRFIYQENNGDLRLALGIRKSEVADSVAVRVLAYCSYVTLMSSNPSPAIGQIAKTVGLGNLHDSLEGRRIIFELISRKDTLAYKDDEYHGGGVRIGERLRKYLNGDSRNPIIFNESVIQASCNQSGLRSATRHPSWTNDSDTLASHPEPPTQADPPAFPSTASEIMKRMQDYVIGENITPALRRYCCRLAMHLQRKQMIDRGRQPDSPAESVLILGDSGTGKTHTINATAKILDLPIASISACDLTCEGYVGLSISDAVATLLRISGGNNSRSRTAVLHIDEWDKKSRLAETVETAV